MTAGVFPDVVCRGLHIPPTHKETLLAVPTSKDPAVKWSLLIPACGVAVGAIAIMVTILVFVYTSVLPDRVGGIIASNKYLDDKFNGTEKILSELKTSVATLNAQIAEMNIVLERMKDPKVVFENLKRASTKDYSTMAQELPGLRQSLQIIRSTNAKVPERSYHDVADRFIKRYPRAPASVKNEIWLTFLELATTRSAMDARENAPSEDQLRRAKKTGQLFDTGVVDLSQREKWVGTIFKDCKLKVSNPQKTLRLVSVKFVGVDFESLPKNEASENLVAALVTSESSTITKKVMTAYSVDVVVPCCLHPVEPDADKNKEPNKVGAEKSAVRVRLTAGNRKTILRSRQVASSQ